MNSLFRGFINEKNIHNRYIYTIKFKIYMLCTICINGIIECLFSCNVIRLCFCDSMKIRVCFVCLVMTVQVGRLLEISLSGRGNIFYLSCCTEKLDERMRHEVKKLMLLSLRVQMYLLSLVEFLCFA